MARRPSGPLCVSKVSLMASTVQGVFYRCPRGVLCVSKGCSIGVQGVFYRCPSGARGVQGVFYRCPRGVL